MRQMTGIPELGRQMHLGHRLAIALWMSTAKIASCSLSRRTAFSVTDHHNLELVKFGQAGHQRRIIAKQTITVQLDEFVKQQRGHSRPSADDFYA